MAHNQQSIEQPERDCRHHEKVHRGDPISVFTKESLPSLRRRAPPPRHIFGYAGLVNIDAELEKLTMDSWRSPQWIVEAHLADQPTNFQPHSRSTAAAPRFPAPIQSKSSAVPTDHSVWPDNCQCIIDIGNSRQIAPNIGLSIETNGSLFGQARRSTLSCCPKTKISASSAARDRNRSTDILKISLHRSNIRLQHRPILDQLPAGMDLR
jgi:hypothetical protein